MKAGLINVTANPQRTQLSIHHQENVGKGKMMASQNFKKPTHKNQGRQNTISNRESKMCKQERTNCHTNFLTTKRSQRSPINRGLMKTHSPANRRITLIREHLQRVNVYPERANAQDNRAREQDVLVDSNISQSKSTQDVAETDRSESKPAHADTLKNSAVEDENEPVCALSGNENVLKKHSSCENEKITIKGERVKHHVFESGDGDNMSAPGNDQVMNNSTLSREFRDGACDRGVIKDDKNSEIMVTNMNEEKFGNKREPGITTRKTRKLWAKDFLLVDRKISNEIILTKTPKG